MFCYMDKISRKLRKEAYVGHEKFQGRKLCLEGCWEKTLVVKREKTRNMSTY